MAVETRKCTRKAVIWSAVKSFFKSVPCEPRVLENLRSLSDAFEGEIIVRVPVVPTFNANEDEMSRIATLVNSLNVKKVELLPYHRLGGSKYAALGRKAQSFDAPSPETMAKLRKLFEQ